MLLPAGAAQASVVCDNDRCSGLLGAAEGNDSNRGDKSGKFQKDSDKAQSLVHKGTSGMAVKLYRLAGYSGGHTCIKKSEYYMDDLSGHTFTSGYLVDNNISSHQWAWDSSCGRFLNS